MLSRKTTRKAADNGQGLEWAGLEMDRLVTMGGGGGGGGAGG